MREIGFFYSSVEFTVSVDGLQSGLYIQRWLCLNTSGTLWTDLCELREISLTSNGFKSHLSAFCPKRLHRLYILFLSSKQRQIF